MYQSFVFLEMKKAVYRVYRQSLTVPKVGETIPGTKFHMGFGGKAANAAVMCARMGGNVTLVAKLGNDDNGKAYREALKKESVNGILFTDPTEPTGVAQIMVEESTGQNMIIVVPGSNMTLSKSEVHEAEQAIQSASLMCFGLEGNLDAVIELSLIHI